MWTENARRVRSAMRSMHTRSLRVDASGMANVAGMATELIGGVIVVAFIFALVPIVAIFIADANLTGPAATLAGLVPFVLVAVGILVVVGLIRHARSEA